MRVARGRDEVPGHLNILQKRGVRVVDVLVHNSQKNNRERFATEAFEKLVHGRGVQKIAFRRSDRDDSGAPAGEVLAEKLADVTVLSDYENISVLDWLRISGFHLFWRTMLGSSSAPKAMIFESEIPALGLVEDGMGIDYEATPEQLA